MAYQTASQNALRFYSSEYGSSGHEVLTPVYGQPRRDEPKKEEKGFSLSSLSSLFKGKDFKLPSLDGLKFDGIKKEDLILLGIIILLIFDDADLETLIILGLIFFAGFFKKEEKH